MSADLPADAEPLPKTYWDNPSVIRLYLKNLKNVPVTFKFSGSILVDKILSTNPNGWVGRIYLPEFMN
jgi:hypothetical protein